MPGGIGGRGPGNMGGVPAPKFVLAVLEKMALKTEKGSMYGGMQGKLGISSTPES